MDVWEKLYNEAKRVHNPRTVSSMVDAGGVASAILTKAGNIYVGVCIDTCSSLGMCAERNAIANMITNGEHEIDKVIAVMGNGKSGPPCGACQELMMQLGQNGGDIEIMIDYDTRKTVTLGELMPNWWASEGK